MNMSLQVINWAKPVDLRRKRGIIYRIFNKCNGKNYIGKTINTFNQRYRCSGLDFSKSNSKRLISYDVYADIKKYGLENFKIEILVENCFDNFLLLLYEIYYADFFHSYFPNGYNKIKCGNLCSSPRIDRFVRDKNNNLINIYNISAFSRKYNLDAGTMCKLLNSPTMNFCGDFHKFIYTRKEAEIIANAKQGRHILLVRIRDKIYITSNLKKLCDKIGVCSTLFFTKKLIKKVNFY